MMCLQKLFFYQESLYCDPKASLKFVTYFYLLKAQTMAYVEYFVQFTSERFPEDVAQV